MTKFSQISRKTTTGVLAFALAATAFLSILSAQTSFGRISGSIIDPTGASIGGAQILLKNPATQDTRTAKTDDQGFYVITNLPIGSYTMTATQAGFQRAERQGLEVVADGRLTVDFKLTVGDVNQTIEVVAASGEQLNTVSGELAKTIDRKEIENLALNGSNYIELLTLVPGAVVTNPDQFSVTTSLSATNQTINGNRSDSQNLTVDGAFNLVAGSNGSLMNNVNSNFIQEVKIQTSNFSAEYGRTAGPAFNIVTKNGTNQYHGGVFETFRNDRLDARNFFSQVKTKLRYNDFGYDVGGPILKDKLFFFVGQEWKRLRQSASPSRLTVPSTAALNGDFGYTASVVKNPKTGVPYLNNVIPASEITVDGAAFANVYKTMSKLGSFVDKQQANNLILQPDNPLDFSQLLLRADYRFSEKHQMYARRVADENKLIDPYGTFSGSNLPTTPSSRNRPGRSYLIGYTWLPGATIVNELRINGSWASQNIPPYGENWKRATYGFQFNQLFTNGGPYESGIPDTSLNGYANFKGPAFSLHSPSTDIQIADTVSWVHSPHLIKAGFAYIRDRVDQNGRPQYTGNVSFNAGGNTNTTGNAIADMLLGNFRTYSEAGADPMGFFRFSQPGAFVQDSWKVSRKFSLELGLRWEGMIPWYTQANNIVSFDPALYDPSKAVTIVITPGVPSTNGTIVPNSGNIYNGLVRAGSGIPADQAGRVPGSTGPLFTAIPAGAERGFAKYKNAWAPRFGFAYSPFDKTVLRGGYGIFYTRPQGNLIFSQLNLPPITQLSQVENGNIANLGGAGASLLSPLANISAIDPKLNLGSTQQYSLSIQRELVKGATLEVAYVGNLGRHLLRQPDINQVPFDLNAANVAAGSPTPTAALRPYKGYNSISQYRSDSTSNYHALQTYISKRSGRLFLTASYTWAKALGDASGQGDNPENYLDRHYNYGPQSFDRRHVAIGTFVWTLPLMRNFNPVLKYALGGWMFNGTIRYQTGQNYTINANTTLGTRRADYLGGSIYADVQGNNGWFNKAAFAQSPNSRRGNAGVGIAEGPSLQGYNLSLSKNVRYRERYNLKFQTDFFNVINVANFTGLNTTSTDPAFGTLSTAYPPRNIQMSLKFNF